MMERSKQHRGNRTGEYLFYFKLPTITSSNVALAVCFVVVFASSENLTDIKAERGARK